ncbi:aldo/keto reductase [Mucisphaera sp.]|uniref:aldo/keto reductase n=1 Tax=Mucisphaera sp. TaxID=2913024 RepID=UPI003D145015
MVYRRFGQTGLPMPVFSTGGMRYQDGWKDKPLDEIPAEIQENLNNTIRRGWELGITHIETARGYGPSERQLGVVLPELDREKLILQTKIGPTEEGDEFLVHFEESLERLGVDYVDLLSLHGINDSKDIVKSLKAGGCLQAARKLQSEGKVKWVGFSTHGYTDVICRAIDTDCYGGFDYVNLHWYYIFQHNWAAVEAARARDMGVFIISPSDKGGKLYDPPDKLRELCEPLDPMVFNDLFCLSHSEVHTLSLGAARPSDYDKHMETLALLDRADELLPPIVKRLEDAMAETVGVRRPDAWTKLVPDDRTSPSGLNLPILLWLRNLAVGWDLIEYGKMRFNLFGSGGAWFPGYRPAEALPTIKDEELIEACSGCPVAAAVPEMLREALQLMGGEKVKRESAS